MRQRDRVRAGDKHWNLIRIYLVFYVSRIRPETCRALYYREVMEKRRNQPRSLENKEMRENQESLVSKMPREKNDKKEATDLQGQTPLE